VPEESPAYLVRELCVWIQEGDVHVPEEFVKYALWFTNVEMVSLLGFGRSSLSQIRPAWRLSQSVTSLIVRTDTFTLAGVRDLLAQLPNLDDLLLSGHFSDNRAPLRIGTATMGRFGGRLQLLMGPAQEDVMNMLSEVPTGLRFTEVEICCIYKSLAPTVKLADACAATLVRLSYAISTHGKPRFPSGFLAPTLTPSLYCRRH